MHQDGSVRREQALIAVVGVVTAVVGLVAMVAVARPAAALGMRAAILVSELVLVAPGLVGLALLTLLLGVPLAPALALRRADRRTALFSLLAGVVFWIASVGLIETQSALWPPDPLYIEAFRRLHEALRPRDALDAAFSLAAIALMPALCEEILIRGIVLTSLVPLLGGAGAVAASSFLFGIIHLDPYRFVFTVAAGVALGALRLRTGSIVPSILAHATLNAITFLAAPLLDDPSQTVPEPHLLLGAALLLAGGAASVVVVRAARVR